MGLLNGFLKGLGFETENEPKEQNKERISIINSRANYSNNGAEYDLKTIKIQKEPQKFEPTNQSEVQQIVDALKKGEDVIADLKALSGNEYTRALDFISGAIYCLDSKIKKMGDKTFLFCQKVN